jgi:hypothetical protein
MDDASGIVRAYAGNFLQFGCISRIDVDILTFFQFPWIIVLGSVFLPFISSSYSCLLIAVVVSFSWVRHVCVLMPLISTDRPIS